MALNSEDLVEGKALSFPSNLTKRVKRPPNDISSPAVALNIEELIEDGISEILLRLPIKSILRSQTVSKHWLSIVSSPLFRRFHASRSIGHATGLFFTKWGEPKSPNQVHKFLNLMGGQITTRILPSITSSSGGLLLLQSKSSSGFQNYIVCNPTTNEFKHLPLAPPPITDSPVVLPYLAFDPCKSPNYKVLFLCLDKDFEINSESNGFEYVIYSSETESFSSPKQLPVTCLKYSFKYLIYGGYCNNAMHWISDEKDSFYYFNLNTEIMKHGPLPHSFPFCKCFVVSRDHLFLGAVWGTGIVVYELKSDYSGWSKKFRIYIGFVANEIEMKIHVHSRMRRSGFTVLSIIVDREDKENLMLVLITDGYFVAYNCKLRQCVILGGGNQMLEVGDYKYRHGSWPYIETLACV